MAAPTWDEYMAPSLRVLADGEVHRFRDVARAAADLLGVTEEQRNILIPSGQQQYTNRSGWALSYLARVGAVTRPSRGRYEITGVGRQLLACVGRDRSRKMAAFMDALPFTYVEGGRAVGRRAGVPPAG